MAASRPVLTASQLHDLGVVRLNLGSGTHIGRDYGDPGMLYVDGDEPPPGAAAGSCGDDRLAVIDHRFVYMQTLVPPIAIEDGAVEGVLCEHLVEHVPPARAGILCAEILRVLKPGGTLRLSTPDLERYCRRVYGMSPRARAFMRARRTKLREMLPLVPQLGELHAATGEEFSRAFIVNQAMRCWGHEWLYDADAIVRLLSQSGFVDVRRRRHGRGTNSLARWDNPYRRDESLYVEARRPA